MSHCRDTAIHPSNKQSTDQKLEDPAICRLFERAINTRSVYSSISPYFRLLSVGRVYNFPDGPREHPEAYAGKPWASYEYDWLTRSTI